MTKRPARGVTKAQWIEAALQALAEGGVEGISIVNLAKTLGITKAGFYWHFQNRQELLDELFATWHHESTEITTKNKLIAQLDPEQRLIAVAEMVHDYRLGRYELSLRSWARTDDRARRAVKEADQSRFRFVNRAFKDLGFTGDELQVRTMLFVGYASGENIFLGNISRKRRRELIKKRVALLAAK